MRARAWLLISGVLAFGRIAFAQQPGYGGYGPAPSTQYPPQQAPPQGQYGPGYAQGQYGSGAPQGQYGSGYAQGQYGGQGQFGSTAPFPGTSPRTQTRASSTFEIGTLYATAVGYGVGLGVWIDSEAKITDPGTALILPAVLGVAAPFGVYFMDQPSMPRGKPSAIAVGMLIGAGEGLGIAGTQFVTSDKDTAWGFRGLGRSVALGSTLGGVGGYLVGEYMEPAPQSNAFVMSGVAWGTLIGASFAYGASPAGVGYGKSNDYAAIGGLVGFNVGLAATAGLSSVFIPTYRQLTGMWAGAGIGAVASLPVFLFYAGDSTPPAKRGLVFTGTAMTLGLAAGALITAGGDSSRDQASERPDKSPITISYVAPMSVPGGAGLSMGGIIE